MEFRLIYQSVAHCLFQFFHKALRHLTFATSMHDIEKKVPISSFVRPQNIALCFVKEGYCSGGCIVQTQVTAGDLRAGSLRFFCDASDDSVGVLFL